LTAAAALLAACSPRAEDFERLPPAYAAATTRLCARAAFLEPGDPKVWSAGDFLGRARALFGAPDPGDLWVLRHKKSGVVLTLSSAAGGPAFGGGPVYAGALPPPDPVQLRTENFEANRRRAAASPQPGPAEQALVQAALRAGRLQEAQARLCRSAAPAGFATLAESLERLLDKARPADFESVREGRDARLVRIGVRRGQSFLEPLSAEESLAYRLEVLAHAGPDTPRYHTCGPALRAFAALAPTARTERAAAPLRACWRGWADELERASEDEADEEGLGAEAEEEEEEDESEEAPRPAQCRALKESEAALGLDGEGAFARLATRACKVVRPPRPLDP
jgi:hypothetical protein